MNFTVNGERVFKSAGKFTKKEAKQLEALARHKLMNEAGLTPQERAARMPLLDAVLYRLPRSMLTLLHISLHMQQQCLNYDGEPATFLTQVHAENNKNVANKCSKPCNITSA